MFNIFKQKEIYINAPFKGEVIELENVADQVFSQKMLGDGFAIIPEENILKSPVNGEIIQIFPTGHALGIKTKDGLELLIHLGIDTVELAGQGFNKLVEEGAKIKQGRALIEFDLDYIRENSPSTATPIVITNMEKIKKIEILKKGSVKAGQKILKVILA
ncbi:PTS glucose transporter subunit IIA [Halanaerobium sp. Z-7514]|uniref:PTS glucose transporter subunit IIA n=1 Tax=Halanaerobium polyolivorans TaxID=2886943 RepID=A0AAW4X2G8_9FIRM|nr:PTS glucose transporter subunit IIA [Halanaerobium polyolivorans]MCC3146011.1 PTS glucose transporter subunit IIA [Halanaerobium polyolivorans]RQD78775.1 MAG: PTS glucose transporter subunit IIA [Halanaerobium sp. MSAO_Bac5]